MDLCLDFELESDLAVIWNNNTQMKDRVALISLKLQTWQPGRIKAGATSVWSESDLELEGKQKDSSPTTQGKDTCGENQQIWKWCLNLLPPVNSLQKMPENINSGGKSLGGYLIIEMCRQLWYVSANRCIFVFTNTETALHRLNINIVPVHNMNTLSQEEKMVILFSEGSHVPPTHTVDRLPVHTVVTFESTYCWKLPCLL